MIQLASRPVPPAAQTRLATLHTRVRNERTFAAKVARAGNQWDSKTSSIVGKQAFEAVKATLRTMTLATNICQYCETNEAGDIEHIYPKWYFPDRCFQWRNYLYACKTCNTTHKSDNFAVFSPAASSTLLKLVPDYAAPCAPPSAQAGLINPRVENPMDFLWLDIAQGTFQFSWHPRLTSNRDHLRVAYTIELLGLKREVLRDSRAAACRFFHGELRKYRDLEAATTLSALEAVVELPDVLRLGQPLLVEKPRLLAAVKSAILRHRHPTVWRELQRQHLQLPASTRDLFVDTGAWRW